MEFPVFRTESAIYIFKKVFRFYIYIIVQVALVTRGGGDIQLSENKEFVWSNQSKWLKIVIKYLGKQFYIDIVINQFVFIKTLSICFLFFFFQEAEQEEVKQTTQQEETTQKCDDEDNSGTSLPVIFNNFIHILNNVACTIHITCKSQN